MPRVPDPGVFALPPRSNPTGMENSMPRSRKESSRYCHEVTANETSLSGQKKCVHFAPRMATADFIQLMKTGLSRGNLPSHMSKLEEAGYIKVEKSFAGKAPRTRLSLTDEGREALREYRLTMEPLIAALP